MPERPAKFDFYEKVLVTCLDPHKHARTGDLGAVMGKSQDEEGDWYYSVHIYRLGESSMFSEDELASTGEFDRRETFYDGSSMRVRLDEGGEGDIAEKSDKDKS